MTEGLILSLETSTPVCSLALHQSGQILGEQTYYLDKSHSSLLPQALSELTTNCGCQLRDLSAMAISSGPGSYTGLRIGLSTAKGICYALGVPLISIGTLDTLVEQALGWISDSTLIAPMLDARRMEVYTKIVTWQGEEIWPLQPLILEPDTFQEFNQSKMLLVGSGATKCDGFLKHPQMHIRGDVDPSAAAMGRLAWEKYQQSAFEDLAYFEPNYLKAFQTKPPSNKFKP